MKKVLGRKRNRHFGYFIAGLVIPITVVLSSAVYGYTALGESHVTSVNVYGPSHLKGSLAGASVVTRTGSVTFSVVGPSHLKGPLK